MSGLEDEAADDMPSPQGGGHPLRRLYACRRLTAQPAFAGATALALGALATLAFAPFFWWPVLAIAFSGLFALIARSPSPRAAMARGWWFGLGHFAAGLAWIAEAFRQRADVPDALGPPAVLLLAGFLALYPALVGFFWRMQPMRARRGIVGPISFAALWMLGEYLRGILFTGFPWNPIASTLSFDARAMQILAWLGPHATGLVILFWALLPTCWSAWLPPGNRRIALVSAVLFAVIPLAIAGLGMLRIAIVGDPGPVEGVVLRLVQPAIPQREKWDPDQRAAHLADLLRLSNRLGTPEGERLVVIWPEAAITDYRLAEHPGRRALLARLLPDEAILISGAPRAEKRPDGHWQVFNSLIVLGSHGELLAGYDKRHLVPFGEFLPFGGIIRRFGLAKLTEGSIDFSPGRTDPVVSVPGLPPFRALICYEIIFPLVSTEKSSPDPRFLLNLTNDAWFGEAGGPHQHFAIARMRAVERGIPLVRVAQTGISAVVDPLGRLEGRIGLGLRSSMDVRLPQPLAKPSFYSRHGEIVFFFLLILILFLAIMPGVRRF
ncbi:MAG: apolipoprotein N-acyltransferase [Alphaproteobacteria bacterium]|nr:MAG: apolipoprotein N-acyltransferase [Alphaproteobacteria bacterium]